MKYETFEDLPVWKASMQLTTVIYQITKKGKWFNDFALRDQIRRAAISISSNISEGFDRGSTNEFVRFLLIAKGSAGEVRNQVHIAYNLDYIDAQTFAEINLQLMQLAKEIGGFFKYLHNYRKN